jgi:hypothetical protein
MVTKQQAMTCSEFHYGTCTRTVGPRGAVKEHIEHWRANGMCHTWVTRPNDFRLPIKYGLHGYSYLDPHNAANFHVASDCPLLKDPVERIKKGIKLHWGLWQGQSVKTPCGIGTVQATHPELGILVDIPEMGAMWSKPEHTTFPE